MNLIRNYCASRHGLFVQITIVASKFFISNESSNFHFRTSADYIGPSYIVYYTYLVGYVNSIFNIPPNTYSNGGGGFVEADVDVEVPSVVVALGTIFTSVLVADAEVPTIVMDVCVMFVPVPVAGPEFPTVVVAIGAIFTSVLIAGAGTFSSGSLTTIFSFFATSV